MSVIGTIILQENGTKVQFEIPQDKLSQVINLIPKEKLVKAIDLIKTPKKDQSILKDEKKARAERMNINTEALKGNFYWKCNCGKIYMTNNKFCKKHFNSGCIGIERGVYGTNK